MGVAGIEPRSAEWAAVTLTTYPRRLAAAEQKLRVLVFESPWLLFRCDGETGSRLVPVLNCPFKNSKGPCDSLGSPLTDEGSLKRPRGCASVTRKFLLFFRARRILYLNAFFKR